MMLSIIIKYYFFETQVLSFIVNRYHSSDSSLTGRLFSTLNEAQVLRYREFGEPSEVLKLVINPPLAPLTRF